MTVLQSLSKGLSVDQIQLIVLQGLQFVVCIILEGLNDLQLGAQLVRLEVVHHVLLLFRGRLGVQQ